MTNKEDDTICLAILNMTSWAGQCPGAEHVYGHLILSTDKTVTVDNVDEYSVRHLGESIELKRTLTLEEATMLGEKEGANSLLRDKESVVNLAINYWKAGDKSTIRFDTIPQVVDVAVAEWKKMDIDCPFISLFDGERYDYKSNKTIVLFKK